MRLLVTPTFARAAKKLRTAQKAELDRAVQAIADDPAIGDAKVGDLAGVCASKFRLSNQLCLLAYTQTDDATITLLALGSHETVYRDLKRP